jgi:acyl carrier protein
VQTTEGGRELSDTENRIAAMVADVSSNVTVGEGDYDTPLKDLGVDSLDVAGIFLAIYEKLGVRVPDNEIDRLNTVRLIAAYMDAKR